MVPAVYATPAAVVLLLGGLLSCFAGYRLFRVVLGLYGFIYGATFTMSMMTQSNTFALVIAAIVGGIVGAILMVAAYFVGVGLIGAGLAVLLLESGWQMARHSDPPTIVLVVVAVLGALLALSVVRYVVVFGTAISGSWTAILAGLALSGSASERAAVEANAWLLYPLGPPPARWWFYTAWIVLSIVGVIVQLMTTTAMGGAKKKKV
jgi:hypothetical protein